MMPESTIASFILRFTQEQPCTSGLAASTWRGAIRHVQSDDEARFTHMEEALAFIARYVDMGANRQPSQPEE